MKRIAISLFWSLLFLLILLGTDQLFLRVPFAAPGVVQIQEFYLDFRTRLLGLGASASVESIIESAQAERSKPSPPKDGGPRYLYVGGGGELNFAESLEEVPLSFRKDAQRLAR